MAAKDEEPVCPEGQIWVALMGCYNMDCVNRKKLRNWYATINRRTNTVVRKYENCPACNRRGHVIPLCTTYVTPDRVYTYVTPEDRERMRKVK